MAVIGAVWYSFTIAALMSCTISTVTSFPVISVKPSSCLSNGSHSDIDLALMNITSDVTIELEPGTHCIRTFDSILENFTNVTIVGTGNVTITCNHGFGLVFYNTSCLTIKNVTIDGCGVTNKKIIEFQNIVNKTLDLFYTINERGNNSIAVLCGYCVNFNMRNVTIANTDGLGFLGINLAGDSTLDGVTASHNAPSECFYLNYQQLLADRIGGGILLIYVDYRDEANRNTSSLHVDNSRFLYNSYCGLAELSRFYADYSDGDRLSNFVLTAGGGLSLHLAQISYAVNVTASRSLFQNNTARTGGGVSINVFTMVLNSFVTFTDCSFNKNGLEGEIATYRSFAATGTGMTILLDIRHPRLNNIVSINDMPTLITVSYSNFTENRAFTAAGVAVVSLYAPIFNKKYHNTVIFETCQFDQNIAYLGAAVYIQEWKYNAGQPGLHVLLHNVNVKNNTLFKVTEVSSRESNSAIVHVLATNVTLSGKSMIQDNGGTGLFIDSGILHVNGDIAFINNSASYGGGLRLETASLLIISNNSHVSFINNSGSVLGGGIYSNYLPAYQGFRIPDCFVYFGPLDTLCFQDFNERCTNISTLKVTLRFEGNQSPRGNMMYGSTLDSCPWAIYLKQIHNDSRNILQVLYDRQQDGHPTPMEFDSPPNTTEAATTETNRITLFNETNGAIEAIPGHPLTLYVGAFDQFNRLSLSVLTSFVSRNDIVEFGHHSSLGNTNFWFLEGKQDSDTSFVPLTLRGNPSNLEDFNVTLLSTESYAQVVITVRLVDCPAGFQLVNGSCLCDERLLNYTRIRCNVNSTLIVPNDVWIGYGNDNDSLLIANCHFDFCLDGERNTEANNFSSQCNLDYHRDGVGCGLCEEGYSIVFGSNRCLECSTSNLYWIVIFALFGLTLISVFSFFRVSISNGYLNGVLLFSNILALFIPVFSSGTNLTGLFNIISWLNLDIGFEICFFDGMKALDRAALHFVFPLYLYFLMLVIIGISKVSQKFADRFNRNGYSTTKLFATLFVMSYSSLLRSCTEVLGYDTVVDLDGNGYTVWRSDVNQLYFQGGHIPLCLLSIFIFAVYLLPAPFILMFPGAVLRVKILKKYKPLYDAFWAPFKPKFRFWIGLRLILRILPFMFAYFFPTPFNILSLGIFLLVLMYLQAVFQPFDGVGRNASDSFFLANLITITLGALYFYVYFYSGQEVAVSLASVIARVHVFQQWYYGILIGAAYFVIVILLIRVILVRFPILKYYMWKLISTVCFCKYCVKWVPNPPEHIHKTTANKKKYGTMSEESSTSVSIEDPNGEIPKESKLVVNYSELREPLLESSGSVELEPRHHTT